jgi:hypothetical protein
MLSALYTLITHPLKFTTLQAPRTYKQVSLVCLGIASVSFVAGTSFYSFFRLGLCSLVILILATGITAIIIDFFAQCWGCVGRSLDLFIGFNTTLIVFGFFPPLILIRHHLPDLFMGILSMFPLMLLLCIGYWQYRLIQSIYKVNKMKSLALLMSPYLLGMGLFMTAIIWVSI